MLLALSSTRCLSNCLPNFDRPRRGRMYPAFTGSDDNAFDIESATGEHVGSLPRCCLDTAQAINGCTDLFNSMGGAHTFHHSPFVIHHSSFTTHSPLCPFITACGSSEVFVLRHGGMARGLLSGALFYVFFHEIFFSGRRNFSIIDEK